MFEDWQASTPFPYEQVFDDLDDVTDGAPDERLIDHINALTREIANQREQRNREQYAFSSIINWISEGRGIEDPRQRAAAAHFMILAKGKSLSQVAKVFGVSKQAVHKGAKSLKKEFARIRSHYETHQLELGMKIEYRPKPKK